MLEIFKRLFVKPNDSHLREAINNGAFLVDVRTPAEYAFGSVKGAVNIPLDRVFAELYKFKEKKSIVVFCRSGARSSQMKTILEQHGIKHVINGGRWQQVNQLVIGNN